MRLRNLTFDLGLRRQHRVDVPVIALGNLTTGGTGKTPMVASLVDKLRAAGRVPGIVSRGYRGSAEAAATSTPPTGLAPDHQRGRSTRQGGSAPDSTGNDEFRVLKVLCPATPHVQHPDRVRAARSVIAEGCDSIVADDGFQHRRLARNLDVVLIDALQPWGHGYLLPRGLLREARRGLLRADLVIVTRADQVDEAARRAIHAEVRRWNPALPDIAVAFSPDGFVQAPPPSSVQPGPVPGFEQPCTEQPCTEQPCTEQQVSGPSSRVATCPESVFACCAIGNPDAFRRTLEQAGCRVLGLRAFRDHHDYRPEDLISVASEARRVGAGAIVTTLKDLVKINAPEADGLPVFALQIRPRFLYGESDLDAALNRAVCDGRDSTPASTTR